MTSVMYNITNGKAYYAQVRKTCDYDYDERNISVIICDSDIP